MISLYQTLQIYNRYIYFLLHFPYIIVLGLPGLELLLLMGFTWIHIYEPYRFILDTQADHELTAKQEILIYFLHDRTKLWPKCGFLNPFYSVLMKQTKHTSLPALKELLFFYVFTSKVFSSCSYPQQL